MNDYLLDEAIVPVHHHSGDDRKDFLLDIGDGTGDARGVSRAEAGRLARARCGIAGLSGEHLEAGPDDVDPDDEGDAGGTSRRLVLGAASAGALGMLLAPNIQARHVYSSDAASKGSDVLVVVFLRGGFDGLSALVPADARYRSARPGIGVTAGRGLVELNSAWGLHPGMSALMPMWSAKQLAFVPASGNFAPTRSHFAAQESMERGSGHGSRAALTRTGWLGRYLAARSSKGGTFRAITMGGTATASLTAAFPTLAMATLEDFDLSGWGGHLPYVKKILERSYGSAGGQVAAQAEATLRAIGEVGKVQASRPAPTAAARYPDTDFARSLRDVAAVIRTGKPLEVACVDCGNWDMHEDLGRADDARGWFTTQIRDFSEALAAFRTDLGSHWGRVTVVTMSEFGRRLKENNSGGLDHGRGGVMMLAGGGVAGGKVAGAWPGLAPSVLDAGDVPVVNDYRRVLTEVLTDRMAPVSMGRVFPNHKVASPLGVTRPR